jgi:hypothetical protein
MPALRSAPLPSEGRSVPPLRHPSDPGFNRGLTVGLPLPSPYPPTFRSTPALTFAGIPKILMNPGAADWSNTSAAS